jgi:diguanylate cyclase (GGDEF)-like protein/PAS domain S-box-containing protein
MRSEEELETRLAYLSAAVDASDDAVMCLDAVGRLTRWNTGAERLLGWRMAAGALLEDRLRPEDRVRWRRAVDLTLGGQLVEHVDLVVQRANRLVIPVRATLAPARAADGVPLGVTVTLRDMEEQVDAQATLAESAQRVAESEALAHVGSWAWDASTGSVQWSEEQHRINGLAVGAFAGTMDAQLQCLHAADRRRLAAAIETSVRTAAALDVELRVLRADQSVRWVDCRASPVLGRQGEVLGLRGIYHDITDRHESAQVLREANERLTQLALYDRLTGLPNRVLLVDRLAESIVRARQFGTDLNLVYLGVDDFRTINDSAGHRAGDQVLIALAPVLGAAVRQVARPGVAPSRALARLGGDEFAIVLVDGNPQQLADSIQGLLRKPLLLPDDEVFISVSIGNAHVHPAREELTAETVLAEANIAMHEAKRLGKSRYVSFEPRMHQAARERHRLGLELHQALADGQFLVRYQPTVSLATGRLLGVEALLRWNHPTRGIVGPDSFIARAEETGLIVPLGAYVLEQACLQGVTWSHETGMALTVAVNVSGRQLREHGFAEQVRSALVRSGLPASQLCLEMTESILMERDDLALDILTTLRAEGVHLAIDDFGTGYSSLAALRRLPVDQLKIDRSFVAGLPEDDNAATIAWAIVHLGHALDLHVLAEGVETEGQRDALLSFGCDEAQGFLYGRAMTPREISALALQTTKHTETLPLPRVPGSMELSDPDVPATVRRPAAGR